MLDKLIMLAMSPQVKLDLIRELIVTLLQQLDECPKGQLMVLEVLTKNLEKLKEIETERKADEAFMADVRQCEKNKTCSFRPEGHNEQSPEEAEEMPGELAGLLALLGTKTDVPH